MKRLIALLLVLALAVSLFATAVFAANPFKDINPKDWFYNDIISAYDMGLINGKTATEYKPNDYLTYAEAVKLAACMNQRYTTGAVTLKNGSPQWYQSYVDYSKGAGIITKDYEWNQPATRAGYMEIFANALPDDALPAINEVPDGSIPDVSMKHPQAPAIYKLYRAGILQGVNAAHNCNPASNIKRAEVAAILNRMMDSTARIEFSMESLYIEEQPADMYSDGGDVSFFVKAGGGKAPYTYQWETRRGEGAWKEYLDATKDTLNISVTRSDIYLDLQFRCVITDAAGKKITSEAARILLDLVIVTQPEGGVVKAGEDMMAFVEVEGGKGPYEYQWQAEDGGRWLNAPGQTYDKLLMEVAESAIGDDLVYRCRITDANGTEVYTDPAVFTIVEGGALRIQTQPQDVSCEAGDLAQMTVVAVGGKAPYTYQWQIYGNFVPVGSWVDSTSDTKQTMTYDTTGAEWERTRYRCIVTDADGNQVISNEALLSVSGPELKIVSEPSSTRLKEGSKPVFYVEVAGGKAPYTFKWMNISQGQHVELSGDGVKTRSDAVYGWSEMQMIVGGPFDWTTNEEFYCLVTDAAGNKAQTSVFQIDYAGPIALVPSAPQQVKPGSTATLSIVAFGGFSGSYKFIWMGGNEHTTAVTGWNGVSISTGGNRSVMTIDTSKCTKTQFSCRVEDANDSSNYKVVDFSYKIQN